MKRFALPPIGGSPVTYCLGERGLSLIFINADLAKPAVYTVLAIATALGCNSTYSQAADLPSGDYAYVAPVAIAPSGWQFRVTPYAWAPSVNGDVTVRGHTADIDFSFWDLFDSGSSGAELESLAALMGYVEARKGAWGIYGDVVWGKFDFSGDAVTQRNPIAELKVKARADAGLDYETTMAESGLTYEVARWGGTRSSTALDVLGGARYWNQELDLSLAVDASVDAWQSGPQKVGFARRRAIRCRSNGSTRSLDLRVRHQLAPGQEASIPRRCRRLWRRQRFHLAALRRLQFRLRGLADYPSRSRGLSRVGCRLHTRWSKQEQPRPGLARASRWIELPLVIIVESSGSQRPTFPTLIILIRSFGRQ